MRDGQKLRVLDLFSGIGGFSLGLERTGGFETVAFCEIDPFCQKVLKKHWPDVPIFEDVTKLRASDIDGPIDIICGGAPCQPFSSASAGRRSGIEDDRYLWPEMLRLVEALGPAWVLGENVDGFSNMALANVQAGLEACSYGLWCASIPALAVDAHHFRERLWFVGHADTNGKPAFAQHDETSWVPELVRDNWRWPDPPEPLGVGHGVSGRLDRLRALGNAVVPQIPEIIGHAILKAHYE